MRLISVTKQYEKRIVLGGLSLEIPDGKVTCVLGKSGAGKTTTLNVICGMTDFEGIVENAPSRVGYVFQEDRLIPHMSICENLQFVGGRDATKPYLMMVEAVKGGKPNVEILPTICNIKE